jgi:hypothetical protein
MISFVIAFSSPNEFAFFPFFLLFIEIIIIIKTHPNSSLFDCNRDIFWLLFTDAVFVVVVVVVMI